MAKGTRDVLLTEGMRLFGEQGYTATSVAQIESAAGLSPGSGALYKHFRSKEALLAAGLDRLLSGGRDLLDKLDSAPAGLVEQMTAASYAALRRLEEDRDLNRFLFRGLEAFPELLQRFGDEEIGRFHDIATTMMTELAGDRADDVDWEAVTVVLQGAAVNYWLLSDLFGRHPTGVDEDRFVSALVALALGLLTGTPPPERDHEGTAAAATGRPTRTRETS